jgi:N-acetylglucosamine-6-phosphate deacetylase
VLFNDQPTLDSVFTIAAAHRKFGTTTLLPTLITDSDEKVRLALHTANAAIGRYPGILEQAVLATMVQMAANAILWHVQQ